MESVTKIITHQDLGSKIICSVCNKERKPMTLDFAGIKKTVYPICKCEEELYTRQYEEDEKAERLRRLEHLFKQTRLGDRFKRCSFESFHVRKGTEKGFESAKDYADNFQSHKKEGKVLLLSGPPGTGKTHLSAAITNQLVKEMISVIFVVVPELMQQIRNTYNKDNQEKESQIMYGLSECDLLILDDIGSEKTSDWTMEKLFTVIDSRYRNHKAMIFTTNCNSKELQERLGQRTFSRIMDGCIPIKMDAEDFRLMNF